VLLAGLPLVAVEQPRRSSSVYALIYGIAALGWRLLMGLGRAW
jgi:hypothetical protein